MMKHSGKFFTVMVLFLILIMSLSGTALAKTYLQMPLGGVSGSFYITGAAVCKYVNTNSDKIEVTPNTSGGGVENLRRINQGVAQLGMTMPETMFQAWNGVGPFEGNKMRDWQVIGVTTKVMADHTVALAKTNIRKIEDVKGHVFAIGAPGSGAAVGMKLFLDHIGIANDIKIRMLPHKDYPKLLLDGKIDVFNRLGAVPAAVVEEVAAQQKITLVDFKEALEKSKFFEKHPYYQKVIIKGGTYKHENRDITFFGSAGFFIVRTDVPEDVVYEFTRLAYSDGSIKAMDMTFKGHNLNRTKPLVGNIGPIHPGALKFWKEVGAEIPEPFLK